MKKIYEKLKPEIQNSIQEDLENFPASTKILIDSLCAAIEHSYQES